VVMHHFFHSFQLPIWIRFARNTEISSAFAYHFLFAASSDDIFIFICENELNEISTAAGQAY
jgi:hypothetical protein